MSFDIQSRYVLPQIEERTSYGFKRLDPYTKLFEERIIFLGQGIDDTVANDVMAQLLTLESMDPDRDIMMYINSPGGSFTALTSIYDQESADFNFNHIRTNCFDALLCIQRFSGILHHNGGAYRRPLLFNKYASPIKYCFRSSWN